MTIKFKKLIPEAEIPTKSTEMAIGYDLRIPHEVVVPKGRSVIKLHLLVALPYLIEGKIEPRSGFSAKGIEDIQGIRRNADVITGKVDPDYRDKSIGIIINNNDEPFVLAAKTRLAQISFYRTEAVTLVEGEVEPVESSRNGGFGHTGSV